MLRPKDFIYDDYYGYYLCPENQVLTYRTTNRKNYRGYQSQPEDCQNCPLLSQCTTSQAFQKVVTRHVWKADLEICEDIRHHQGVIDRYRKRKETTERLFGTAKEYHNLRHTRERGKSKMEAKVGLTLACLNLKKTRKMAGRTAFLVCLKFLKLSSFDHKTSKYRKRQTSEIGFVFNLTSPR